MLRSLKYRLILALCLPMLACILGFSSLLASYKPSKVTAPLSNHSFDDVRLTPFFTELSGVSSSEENLYAFFISNSVFLVLAFVPSAIFLIKYTLDQNLKFIAVLRCALNSRNSENLTPIVIENSPLEISPLVKEINSLLARHQTALKSERSITTTTVHELRGYLGSIITQVQHLKLALHERERQSEAAQIEKALFKVLVTFDHVLDIATAEARSTRTAKLVDLNQVLTATINDLEHKYCSSRILRIGGTKKIFSNIEPHLFALVCRNLIENALQHGFQHSEIVVQLDDSCQLTVTNDGPTIRLENIDDLKTAFTLTGLSSDGSGLGLAFVNKIAMKASGVLSLISPPPGQKTGFQACFSFPPYLSG